MRNLWHGLTNKLIITKYKYSGNNSNSNLHKHVTSNETYGCCFFRYKNKAGLHKMNTFILLLFSNIALKHFYKNDKVLKISLALEHEDDQTIFSYESICKVFVKDDNTSQK